METGSIWVCDDPRYCPFPCRTTLRTPFLEKCQVLRFCPFDDWFYALLEIFRDGRVPAALAVNDSPQSVPALPSRGPVPAVPAARAAGPLRLLRRCWGDCGARNGLLAPSRPCGAVSCRAARIGWVGASRPGGSVRARACAGAVPCTSCTTPNGNNAHGSGFFPHTFDTPCIPHKMTS